MTAIRCNQCAADREVKPTAKGEPRLPIGWHRHDGRVWCGDCWRAAYVMRGVTIPVAGPVDCDWPELRATLRAAWSASTRLANWAVGDLYAHDVRRGPDDATKMPAMKPRYQYPEARGVAPEMDTPSVVQLLSEVAGKWRQRRYNVLWTGAESIPNHRYPYPYPVHNKGWAPVSCEEGSPIVSVRLGGQRRQLRLCGGNRYRRQMAAFRAALDGDAKCGTLTIYRQRASEGDHRPTVDGRANGGGQTVRYRVMVRLSLWLPRRAEAGPSGTLFVRTGGEADGALLTYHVDEAEPRYWFAAHARRLCVAYRRRQRALAHDCKAERRRPKRNMRGIRDQQRLLASKYRAAMDAVTHEASAIIAKYAARQRVASVVYDDTDKSFDEQFAWFALRERIGYKLADRTIEFVHQPREPEAVAETP